MYEPRDRLKQGICWAKVGSSNVGPRIQDTMAAYQRPHKCEPYLQLGILSFKGFMAKGICED